MGFQYRTKSDTTPKGKKYIFIHAMNEDAKLLDVVCKKLLSFPQGIGYCLWFSEVPERLFEPEEMEKLREMAVFIPLITERYFQLFENSANVPNAGGLFESLQRQGLAVLPVLETAELLPRFNRVFGELHGISLTLPEADRMLSDQLNRLLPDDDLAERITKEAFSGKLFLSYRKKDIAEAIEIMKAIHDTDAAGAAEIWFDEFLVAGRDFNDEIQENLKNSDAMALAVTPNLLEEGNYVRTVEYKSAKDFGVEVLPVEALPTDADKLEDAFPGLEPSTDVFDKEALEQLLRKAGFQGPGSRSSFAEYLLGMAFLIGINVEKDVDRAVRLFHSSADNNCAEACEQLGKMYIDGIGVAMDYDSAIRYKKKAYQILMQQEVTKDNLRHINRLFYSWDGLPLILKESRRVNEANEIQKAFMERIENSPFNMEDEFILYRVNAATDLANLFYEYDLESGAQKMVADGEPPASIVELLQQSMNTGPDEKRLEKAASYANEALMLLGRYHGEDQELAQFLRVVTIDQFADLAKYQGNLQDAIQFKLSSKALIEPLAEETGNLEYMDRSFQVSNNLGLFYREGAGEQARETGRRVRDLMAPSRAEIDLAVKKARQLESLNPLYRGRLVHALSNRALVEDDILKRAGFALESYEALLKLLKDMDVKAEIAGNLKNIGGEFSNVVFNIKLFTRKKDRKAVFERVYGSGTDENAKPVQKEKKRGLFRRR